MRLRRAFIWFCILCCGGLAGHTALAATPTAMNWGLPQLMHKLAQVRSASAKFTERKTMHILNTEMVTSGTLTYVAPDRVTKITVSPEPERFVLKDNRVTIDGGKDQPLRSFSLTEAPQIAGLVEGIRATLAGDLPALEHFYVVQLFGDAMQWQIMLQPRSTVLAHFISSISIRGSEDRIQAIDTLGANGDHSEMSIVEDALDVH